MSKWIVLLFVLRSFLSASSSILTSEETEDAFEFALECFNEEDSCDLSFHQEMPSKELPIRDQAYSALLGLFHDTFSERKCIDWLNFTVIGWPQKVMFYSSANWSEKDVQYVWEAIQRGQISFVPKTGPRRYVSHQKKKQLKDMTLKVSNEIFGTKLIEWKKLKMLCPNLHLTRNSFVEWHEEDFINLKAALKSLKERFNLKSVTFDEEDEYCSSNRKRKCAEKALISEETSIAKRPKSVLQDLAYSRLLQKYNEIESFDKTYIPWSMVEVFGWPDDVIFYYKNHWSEADANSVLNAMPQIRFAKMVESSGALSKEQKLTLERQVSDFFMKHFLTESKEWSLVKLHMPSFHLTQSQATKWSYKDAQMIEEVFRFFKYDYESI